MASLNFNAANVQPTSEYSPLPNGEYLVLVAASDMKPTKAGGQYLELELEVLEGNFKGRKAWDRINLVNVNPKTVEIAQRQLSSLCHATSVMNVTDSAQLHGIPVIATIKYKEPANGYEASNEIRGYKKVSDGVQSPTSQQASVVPNTSTQAAGATPPWGRK